MEVHCERGYICEVDATQVVSIKPVYEWDVLRVRDHKLLFKNHIYFDTDISFFVFILLNVHNFC